MGNQVMLPCPPSPPNNLEKSYVNSANPQIFEAYYSKVYFKNKAALRQRLIQAGLNEAMLKARLMARQAANSSGEKKGPWQEIDGIGDTDEKINEHDDVAEEHGSGGETERVRHVVREDVDRAAAVAEREQGRECAPRRSRSAR